VSAVTVPPAPCVVITVSVPQFAELQPGPLSDQERTVLGFDPGIGVIVATRVAVPPAGTLAGAVSWSEKSLVMRMAAEICFDGSATLCAVMDAFTDEGRIPGAV